MMKTIIWLIAACAIFSRLIAIPANADITGVQFSPDPAVVYHPVKLMLSGSGNCTIQINWNDQTSSPSNTVSLPYSTTHLYQSADTYQVHIATQDCSDSNGELVVQGVTPGSVVFELCKMTNCNLKDIAVPTAIKFPDLTFVREEAIASLPDLASNKPTLPSVKYVFTLANKGKVFAKPSKVLFECFDGKGGRCPYSSLYPSFTKPINGIPAYSPNFDITNTELKVSVGPLHIGYGGKQVQWRVTVDPDKALAESNEDNNTVIFSYQETRSDLSLSGGMEYANNYNEADETMYVNPHFILWNFGAMAPASRVRINCTSEVGYPCPSSYPQFLDYPPLKVGKNNLGSFRPPPPKLGHWEVRTGLTMNMLRQTKTRWAFTVTADSDNSVQESNENNNKIFGRLDFANTDNDFNTYSTTNNSSMKMNEKSVKSSKLKYHPPKIESVLVIPTKSVPLPPLGQVNPGARIYLKGEGFGKPPTKLLPIANQDKIYLILEDGGFVQLEYVVWKDDKHISGVAPEIIQGLGPNSFGHPDQDAYLRVERLDGQQSPPWKVRYFAGREIKALDSETAKSVVTVVNCGTDSNLDYCNHKKYHEDRGEYGTANPKNAWNGSYAMQGSHSNIVAAIGNDVGVDRFSLKLKNDWVVNKATFTARPSQGADPDTRIFLHTPASDGVGRSDWDAVVGWQVDAGDELIFYGYKIWIEGPVGTSYH